MVICSGVYIVVDERHFLFAVNNIYFGNVVCLRKEGNSNDTYLFWSYITMDDDDDDEDDQNNVGEKAVYMKLSN